MQNTILSGTINNAIITLGDIDDTGKGRHFKSRFIKDGLVKIENHGIVLLKKETLDASLPSMIGTPVIIKHQNVTKKNADKLRCGTISDAYFNEPDGWYYCEGIIWDEDAQELIENQKWSVSCSYDFLSYNDEGGVENNIPYDKEFTDLNFTHLAIVNNPRYERANIVFNCKVENEKWITIKPHGDDSDDYRRLKLEDGETPKEAIDRVYKKEDKKQTDTKEERIEARRKHQEVVKKHNQAYKDFEDGKISMEELDKADKELEKSNKEFYGQSDIKDKQSDTVKEKTLEEKREAYESTLKKLKDAEHKAWHPKDDAEWYQAVKDKDEAKKALTNLRREYAESIMDNFQEVEDNPYQDKLDSKKAYYASKSAEYQKSSERNWQNYQDTKLPFGQPIINPATARAYKTTNRYFDKSVDDYNKSAYYQDKAKTVGTGGISADDKNAIKKLSDKYKSIQKLHQKMVDANKVIKSKLSDDEKHQKLLDIGWSDENAKKIMTPSKWSGSVGFQTYELSSNTAEMRRIIDRVIDIHKNSLKALEKPSTDYSKYGFSVERNTDINRLQLKFPDKPDAETRSKLKSLGFRWSPRESAWQRQLTSNAEYSLKQFINGINNDKENEMALIEELKKMITKIENNKENDMEIENAVVDKRELIDEVGGMLKGKVDEELWRTIVGKLEKMSYDKSEADSADNKKVKNEEDEEKEDKKDKEKVEELKEEVKEDVDNKCGKKVENSKSTFDKINEIYNSIKTVAEEKTYTSRQEKLDNAVEYFKS